MQLVEIWVVTATGNLRRNPSTPKRLDDTRKRYYIDLKKKTEANMNFTSLSVNSRIRMLLKKLRGVWFKRTGF